MILFLSNCSNCVMSCCGGCREQLLLTLRSPELKGSGEGISNLPICITCNKNTKALKSMYRRD